MPRLSDRAFKIIEVEIDSLHNQGYVDHLDRAILISRLRTRQAESGRPLTRAQIWDEISDIIPDIDLKVLTSAACAETGSLGLSVPMGVSAAAMLLAATASMDATTASASVDLPMASLTGWQRNQFEQDRVAYAAKPLVEIGHLAARFTQGAKTASHFDTGFLRTARFGTGHFSTGPFDTARFSTGSMIKADQTDAFEKAKSFGWQAALKAQNPPHSAQHWQETAELWRSAIAQLNQVPESHPSYAQVQPKRAFYQSNLKETEARQTLAAKVAIDKAAAIPTVDYLAIARQQGWKASLAGRHAPHSAQEWANISQIWQRALFNLNQIPPSHTQYAEAQTAKLEYQKNLEAVQQRYQQEQNDNKSIASLPADLSKVD